MPDKWAQYAQPAETPDKWAQYAVPANKAAAPVQVVDPSFGELAGTTGKALGKLGLNAAEGIGESALGTLGGLGDVGTAALRKLGMEETPYGRDMQAGAQYLHELASPENKVQGYLKGTGDVAQFFVPGEAEEAGAGQLARLTPWAGKAAAPLARIATSAASTGAVNKLQGGGFGTGAGLGAAGGAVSEGIGALPRILTGDVHAPISGSSITPAQRYAVLKETGVNPDLAQATNSPFFKGLKAVNRNSLFASPAYERAEASNLGALNRYTEGALDKISPLTAEEGGAAVQRQLLAHHDALRTHATEGFDKLDKELGDKPIMGAPELRNEARKVLVENAPYYKLHPELEPTKAMAIVRDIADTGKGGKPAPKVVTGFGPAAKETARVPRERELTYGELHRLRSDLLDFNNNNPDLVKNRANGWISRLAGAADEAITSSSGSLTPEQVGVFRDANEAWKQMKGTYDNPQSPLYHAVRTAEPSKLVKSGISQSPEMAKELHGALGPGIAPIQRGVAEARLGTTPSGNYNFRNAQGMLNKLPEGYRQALFAPGQLRQLGNIGEAGTVLNIEPNPSGTARLGQKIAEAGEGFSAIPHPAAWGPTAAYHGSQYGLSKMMNSPAVVESLMRGGPKGLPAAARRLARGAVATGLAGSRQRQLLTPWASP